MLRVDVHQARGQGGQDAHLDRTVIDEGAGTPGAVDDPPDQQVASIPFHVAVFQDRADLRVVGVELPLHDAAARPLGDDGRVGLCPRQQGQGAHQDGFPGAGLPGNNDQTPRKRDIQRVYQDVMADMKSPKHLPRPPSGSRGLRFRIRRSPRGPASAASRSIWRFRSAPCSRILRPSCRARCGSPPVSC